MNWINDHDLQAGSSQHPQASLLISPVNAAEGESNWNKDKFSHFYIEVGSAVSHFQSDHNSNSAS